MYVNIYNYLYKHIRIHGNHSVILVVAAYVMMKLYISVHHTHIEMASDTVRNY